MGAVDAIGTIGARLKHEAICKDGILASVDLTGDTSTAGPLEIRDNPEDTATA